MEDKPDDMHGLTDDEGFPKLEIVMAQPSVNPFPLRLRRSRRSQTLENHENGETTKQQVVVIRRRQRDSLVSQEDNTGGPHHLLHRRMTMHFNLIALRNTMPDFKYTHPTCPKGKCAATPMEMGKGRKTPFRIPPEDSPEPQPNTQQGVKVIHVSIMKECYFASDIFSVEATDSKSFRKRSCNCFLVQKANSFSENIPVFYLKVFVLLFMIIKCIWCRVSFPFFMYYRYHMHTKIHRSCEERGVKPVFTGSACHGPIIYGVRNFCCPFCRDQKQSDATLRLLGVLNQERRKQQVT